MGGRREKGGREGEEEEGRMEGEGGKEEVEPLFYPALSAKAEPNYK